MYINVTESIFIANFNEIRPDSFSYEGLITLFDYLIETESGFDSGTELDVIAIDCEWTECKLKKVLEAYNLNSLEELQNNTTVLELSNGRVIYQDY